MAEKISWKSLIEIRTNHAPETAESDTQRISAVLDKVEASDEGQGWLLQLKERLNGKRLPVTTARGMDNSKNIFGWVNINPEELAAERYRGKDGFYHPMTIEQAVIHEIFGHKAAGPDEQQAVNITNLIQSSIGSKEAPRGDYYDTCVEPGMLLASVGPYAIKKIDAAKVIYCSGTRPAEEIEPPSPTPPNSKSKVVLPPR